MSALQSLAEIELDAARESLSSAIRAMEHVLRHAPNGDAARLVQAKLDATNALGSTWAAIASLKLMGGPHGN